MNQPTSGFSIFFSFLQEGANTPKKWDCTESREERLFKVARQRRFRNATASFIVLPWCLFLSGIFKAEKRFCTYFLIRCVVLIGTGK